jgi:hypothetical protein
VLLESDATTPNLGCEGLELQSAQRSDTKALSVGLPTTMTYFAGATFCCSLDSVAFRAFIRSKRPYSILRTSIVCSVNFP